MSIWNARTDLDGRRQCARCHKMFVPRSKDDRYGPKCARIVAAQQHLDALITSEELEDDEVQ